MILKRVELSKPHWADLPHFFNYVSIQADSLKIEEPVCLTIFYSITKLHFFLGFSMTLKTFKPMSPMIYSAMTNNGRISEQK